MTPEQGVSLLVRQQEKARELLSSPPIDGTALGAWRNTTENYLVRCFGSGSPNIRRVMDAGISPPKHFVVAGPSHRPPSDAERAAKRQAEREKHLNAAILMLDSCIEVLRAEAELVPLPSTPRPSLASKEAVFLVHGRDDGLRQTVARFIEALGVEVIILDEQPSRGRTIIEKFEDHAAEACYAVVLMTADDRGGLKTDDPSAYKPRARQNVFFELGYFSARLGRERVCALHESGVEIPTDYEAVNYVPIDAGSAWRLLLGRELRDAGLPVDMNRI